MTFQLGYYPGIGAWTMWQTGDISFGTVAPGSHVTSSFTLTQAQPYFGAASWFAVTEYDGSKFDGAKIRINLTGVEGFTLQTMRWPDDPGPFGPGINYLAPGSSGPYLYALQVDGIAWKGTEPVFHITTNVTGPGTCTVTPGVSVVNEPGTTTHMVIEIDDPLNYAIDSCTLDGLPADPAGFDVVGSWDDRVVEVVTVSLAPVTYKISGTLQYITSSCPYARNLGIAFVDFGGGGSWEQLLLAIDGTVTAEATGISVGDPYNIWAAVPNTSFRIASFVVDGVEKVTQPALNWGTQMDMGTMGASDKTFSVIMIGDVWCRNGPPVTPIPPIQPAPPGWHLPPWWPPGGGTIPLPPGQTPPVTPVPPDSGDVPVIGPSEPGGGEQGGGGQGPGSQPQDGPRGQSGLPVGEVFPAGIDWQTDSRGLIVRWRDNGGRWGREHLHDFTLGQRGKTRLDEHEHSMGKYRTRQYEIVMVDRVPFCLASIEETVEPVEESMAARKKKT